MGERFSFGPYVCVSATLAEYPAPLLKLDVFWVQAEPSVTSIEVRYGTTNPPINLPLSEVDERENRRASQTTVLLAAEFVLNNEMAAKAKADGELKVRLIQSKIPGTDWFPVAVYKAVKQPDGTYQQQLFGGH
jgi:hypothetical protein